MFKKTTAKTPAEYIAKVDEERRIDIKALHALIRKNAPKLRPHLKTGMLGYGTYHYKYASGREGDWAVIALANQKNYISLYVCALDGKKYLPEKYAKQLPKADIGRSCVRFKKLEDLDQEVLVKMIREAAAWKWK
jgi:uncharacterized protein YdhG (YjbR/CyaY superfamily)